LQAIFERSNEEIMDFFLLGKGKVGSALSRHFKNIGKHLIDFDIATTEKSCKGVLFLAVPDSDVKKLTDIISEKFHDLFIIHFSAAADTDQMHLVHPYCSIGKETDLSDILFTLWTADKEALEFAINDAQLNGVYAGTNPSPLYHASAVLSGNFSQFFAIAALELLENEGFEKKEALKLIDQLMLSSLGNTKDGTEGISGPAARGDDTTINSETSELAAKDQQISQTFKTINILIKQAVKNGTVFKK